MSDPIVDATRDLDPEKMSPGDFDQFIEEFEHAKCVLDVVLGGLYTSCDDGRAIFAGMVFMLSKLALHLKGEGDMPKGPQIQGLAIEVTSFMFPGGKLRDSPPFPTETPSDAIPAEPAGSPDS